MQEASVAARQRGQGDARGQCSSKAARALTRAGGGDGLPPLAVGHVPRRKHACSQWAPHQLSARCGALHFAAIWPPGLLAICWTGGGSRWPATCQPGVGPPAGPHNTPTRHAPGPSPGAPLAWPLMGNGLAWLQGQRA